MAVISEHTLQLKHADLVKEVAFFIGYGRTAWASLSVANQATVKSVIDSALRRFYNPPPLDQVKHIWSFLRPHSYITAWPAVDNTNKLTISTVGTAITASSTIFTSAMVGKKIYITGDTGIGTPPTIASVTSGTVAVLSGTITGGDVTGVTFHIEDQESGTTGTVSSTTLTASAAAFFPSMIGRTILVTGDTNADTTISAYTSSTVVTLSAALSDAQTDAITFKISGTEGSTAAHDILMKIGDYSLPNDFGGFASELFFDTDQGYRPVPIVSESIIRARRQISITSGVPQLAAVSPFNRDSSGAGGTAYQTFFLLLWPNPDSTYVLHFNYWALQDALVTSTNEYVTGGQLYSECILSGCLAMAEMKLDGAPGVWFQDYQTQLVAAIEQDRRNGPANLGYCADQSGNDDRRRGRGWYRTNSVTYNGQIGG